MSTASPDTPGGEAFNPSLDMAWLEEGCNTATLLELEHVALRACVELCDVREVTSGVRCKIPVRDNGNLTVIVSDVLRRPIGLEENHRGIAELILTGAGGRLHIYGFEQGYSPAALEITAAALPLAGANLTTDDYRWLCDVWRAATTKGKEAAPDEVVWLLQTSSLPVETYETDHFSQVCADGTSIRGFLQRGDEAHHDETQRRGEKIRTCWLDVKSDGRNYVYSGILNDPGRLQVVTREGTLPGTDPTEERVAELIAVMGHALASGPGPTPDY